MAQGMIKFFGLLAASWKWLILASK